MTNRWGTNINDMERKEVICMPDRFKELFDLENNIAMMQNELYQKAGKLKLDIANGKLEERSLRSSWCDGGCITISPLPPCSGCCVRKSPATATK
jgi:hypothetical protein